MNPALSELRDIHLPPAPGWWPPAPGWWLLGFLALAACVALGWALLRYWRGRRYRKLATRELEILRAECPLEALLPHINALLKRTALAAFPTAGVAPLAGEDWVRFLLEHAQMNPQQQEMLRTLVAAPYQARPDVPETDLLEAARTWIRKHR